MSQENTKLLVLADLHANITDDNHEKLIIDTCLSILKDIGFDFILLLGDLCNKGQHGRTFIRKFKAELSPYFDVTNKLFIIPGNHDLLLPEVSTSGLRDILYKFADKEHKLRRRSSEIYTSIKEKTLQELSKDSFLYFQPYLQIFEEINSEVQENPYCGFKLFPDKRIGFIYLNTCWNSLASDEDFRRIVVGKNILMKLDNDILTTLTKSGLQKEDVVIVALVHHPMSWWCYEEVHSTTQDNITSYDILIKHADLILSGHTHGTLSAHSRITVQLPRSVAHAIHIEAPACFISRPVVDSYPSCIMHLEINPLERIVARTNHVYAQGDGAGNGTFKKSAPFLFDLPSVNLNQNLLPPRTFSDKTQISFKNSVIDPATLKDNIEQIKDQISKRLMANGSTLEDIGGCFLLAKYVVIPIVFETPDQLKAELTQVFNDFFNETYQKLITEKRRFLIFVLYTKRWTKSDVKGTRIDTEEKIFETYSAEIKNFRSSKFYFDKHVSLVLHQVIDA